MSTANRTTDVRVIDNPDQSRYEGWSGDALVGLADYYSAGEGIVSIPHTEVDAAYQGQGIAGVIVQFALDDLRDRGIRVIPACPYVRHWIEQHPEYADLLA